MANTISLESASINDLLEDRHSPYQKNAGFHFPQLLTTLVSDLNTAELPVPRNSRFSLMKQPFSRAMQTAIEKHVNQA